MAVAQTKPFLTFVLGTLAITCISVFVSAAQDATTFTPGKRVLKSGDTVRYTLEMQILPGAKGATPIGVHEKYHVDTTDATSDGGWSQVTKFDFTKVTVAGKDVDVLATMPEITVTRTASGAFSSTAIRGSQEGNVEVVNAIQQIASMPEALLSHSKVKVGSKWKVDFNNSNLMIGAQHLVGTASLTAIEKSGERSVVKITFTARSASKTDANPLMTEGILKLDADSGLLVLLSQKGTGKFAGGSAQVSMDVSLDH